MMLAALLILTSDEFRIFDGKSLQGWHRIGGGSWVVEGGVLKGTCTKADTQGLLEFNGPVKDFEARFQFRISDGNSGFYFRTERIEKSPFVKGMQAEVDAIDDVGGIWETEGRGWVFKPTPEIHSKANFKPGEWSDMFVSAIGSHYVVKLNGAIITDIEDKDGRREGWISLQLHGGMDMTIEYRDIWLKYR